MIRESHTAILERHADFSGTHHTEPYECAWAGEATAFLYAVVPCPDPIALEVEVSADGRRWLPHGTSAVLPAGAEGIRVPISHFGGWLRLRIDGPDATAFKYDLYLVLKQ
ncbi:hypothetical protein EXU48_19855 [Occultella glacieicola]|uniref:Uncharacterized protein n=1 Tax=Occultella glacieicola TaxID=2518684 RepID=A0ABY2E3T6_9MICO|nr:hypothetical protein [Occultella glacieicola]TDE89679.1 hypothetical protein EXU48_19855 [Occultella glacieicola]